MQSDFVIGIILGLLAGLVNGIFLLPMRYTRQWAWENTWLVFTILSTGMFPWVAALLAVPNLVAVFHQCPASYLLPGMIAGGIWGVAQVLYGLGLGMVGIAIGSAVVACTSTTAGTVGPMIAYAHGRLFSSASLVLLVAIGLVIVGIYQYGKAGVQKERETAGKDVPKQVVSGSFRTGLIICLSTGALGTAFIYGSKSSSGLVDAARGVGGAPSQMFAEFTALLATFNAGMIAGVIYSVYKLNKNRTWRAFLTSGSFAWNLALSILMAALWYGGILMYNSSAVKLGVRLGPSIAFALFASGTVLFASLFGWLAGEWKGASRQTVRGFIMGMLLIVVAILVIALGVQM
jgi:L-rhamnose-H+ transport protein